jgi:hypothetical protein
VCKDSQRRLRRYAKRLKCVWVDFVLHGVSIIIRKLSLGARGGKGDQGKPESPVIPSFEGGWLSRWPRPDRPESGNAARAAGRPESTPLFCIVRDSVLCFDALFWNLGTSLLWLPSRNVGWDGIRRMMTQRAVTGRRLHRRPAGRRWKETEQPVEFPRWAPSNSDPGELGWMRRCICAEGHVDWRPGSRANCRVEMRRDCREGGGQCASLPRLPVCSTLVTSDWRHRIFGVYRFFSGLASAAFPKALTPPRSGADLEL